MRARSVAALVMGLVVALPATAADYPTKPDDMDKLCEVMGESSPNITISPMDRLWFKENCTCVTGPNILIDDTHGGAHDTGRGLSACGNPRSKRFKARMSSLVRVTTEENQKLILSIKTKDQQWKAMEPVRDAYWKCSDAVVPGVAPPKGQGRWCEAEIVALDDACSKTILDATQCRAMYTPFRAP